MKYLYSIQIAGGTSFNEVINDIYHLAQDKKLFSWSDMNKYIISVEIPTVLDGVEWFPSSFNVEEIFRCGLVGCFYFRSTPPLNLNLFNFAAMLVSYQDRANFDSEFTLNIYEM